MFYMLRSLRGYISCHIFLLKLTTNNGKQQKRKANNGSLWRRNAGEDGTVVNPCALLMTRYGVELFWYNRPYFVALNGSLLGGLGLSGCGAVDLA